MRYYDWGGGVVPVAPPLVPAACSAPEVDASAGAASAAGPVDPGVAPTVLYTSVLTSPIIFFTSWVLVLILSILLLEIDSLSSWTALLILSACSGLILSFKSCFTSFSAA